MRRSPLTPEQIQGIIDTHKSNIDQIIECNKRLFSSADKKTWLANYNRRAELIRSVYNSNEANSASIDDSLNSTEGFRYEQAEALYHALITNFDLEKYSDPFFHVYPLEMLAKYYTEAGDILRELPLLCRLGIEYMATVKQQCYENSKAAQKCFETVLSLRDKYNLIPDKEVRSCFFTAYYYLACEMTGLGRNSLEINKAAKYLNEMISFYDSPIVQKLDGNSKEILQIVEKAKKKWLEREDIIDKAQPSTRQLFIDIATEMYYKEVAEKNGDTSRVSAIVTLAYFHSRILDGEYTHYGAVQDAMEYYEARKKHTEEAEDTFFFETRFTDALISVWLNSFDVPEEMRDHYRKILIEDRCKNYVKLTKIGKNSPILIEYIYTQCCHSINYMSNQRDKEIAVMEMLMNRSLSTFFHTCMVARLASIIAESIFRNNPSLFLDTFNLTTEDDILLSKPRIIEFINKCALYHDIGKVCVSHTINTQFRRLTQKEKKVLQLHSSLGAEALGEDLYAYHDVVLGHHRTYDMTGGYPMDFDPEASSTKIISDLIAICDALDAATDYLDHAYSKNKTYAAVLIELMKGSGTKYNPDIVMLLRNDEHLYGTINDLLSNRREDLYYEWFSRYNNV